MSARETGGRKSLSLSYSCILSLFKLLHLLYGIIKSSGRVREGRAGSCTGVERGTEINE